MLGGWSIEKPLFDEIFRWIPVGGTLLEFGSGSGDDDLLDRVPGLSTLLSVEHNPKFLINRGPRQRYFVAPIKDGWYDRSIIKKALNEKFDALLIDGPPGFLRFGIANHLYLFKSLSVPVFFDDVNRLPDKSAMIEFCRLLGYQYQIFDGEQKQYALCLKLG